MIIKVSWNLFFEAKQTLIQTLKHNLFYAGNEIARFFAARNRSTVQDCVDFGRSLSANLHVGARQHAQENIHAQIACLGPFVMNNSVRVEKRCCNAARRSGAA